MTSRRPSLREPVTTRAPGIGASPARVAAPIPLDAAGDDRALALERRPCADQITGASRNEFRLPDV